MPLYTTYTHASITNSRERKAGPLPPRVREHLIHVEVRVYGSLTRRSSGIFSMMGVLLDAIT
ncbi:hypothetical protein B9Z19DRAFT_1073363 [Tuber borchii]|uniref:Uncharacterized protein n=1 Tax=Tuber borchii TaxID=42251 RepID=A0A2T7A6B8_TUBBO|nr:hypothetical protein B9Z19DRAFT_1073363 [Tuber borchii]